MNNLVDSLRNKTIKNIECWLVPLIVTRESGTDANGNLYPLAFGHGPKILFKISEDDICRITEEFVGDDYISTTMAYSCEQSLKELVIDYRKQGYDVHVTFNDGTEQNFVTRKWSA